MIQCPNVSLLGSVLMLRCEQFSDGPHVIGEAAFHRRSHAKALVYPAEVVIGEMQGARGFQIIQFLRESVGKASKAPNRLAHREILALYETGGDAAHIWASIAYFYYCLNHRSGRVASSGVVLPVISVQLYHLGKVSLSGKNVLNIFPVEVESIGCDLDAVFFRHPVAKRSEELVGSSTVPLPNSVGGDQLGFCINSYEHPSITDFGRIFRFYVALFLCNECPDFVALNVFASQIPHLGIHQSYTPLASKNQKAEDRIAVQSGDSLRTANAGAFDEQLNCEQRLVFGNGHRREQSDMIFGVRPTALGATKAAKTVAMLAVLATFAVACWAIHGLKLQQAVAVCQEKTKVVRRRERDRKASKPQTWGVI